MKNEKSVSSKIQEYIKNKFESTNNTETEHDIKNEELNNIVSYDIGKTIEQTRPYTNVISNIDILESAINILDIQGTKAYAEIKVTRRVYPVNMENSRTTTQVATEPLELNLQENGWIVISNDLDTISLDGDNYDNDEDVDYSVYSTGELISMYLKSNIVKLSNITYEHKGAPEKNPLEYPNETFNIDMFNLYYWLLEEVGEVHDLDYPVTKYDFLNSDTFIKVRDKGHKYGSDVFRLSVGDILFFGTNNTTIGVYVGDGQMITLLGKFPKDNTTPRVYTIKDSWWNEFNGMVYRLRSDEYNGK